MWLLLMISCGITGTSGPVGNPVPATQPAPHVAPEPVDQAAEGRSSAEASFKRGQVQVIDFGELAPPGYLDRKTDLPLGSMGCEPSEDMVPYRDAFNTRMLELVAETPPLPAGLRVVYEVRDAATYDVVVLESNKVTVNGKPRFPHKETLMKVGLLSQQLISDVPVPASLAGTNPGETERHTLTVTDGAGTRGVAWTTPGAGNPAAETATLPEGLHESLLSLRAGRQ